MNTNSLVGVHSQRLNKINYKHFFIAIKQKLSFAYGSMVILCFSFIILFLSLSPYYIQSTLGFSELAYGFIVGACSTGYFIGTLCSKKIASQKYTSIIKKSVALLLLLSFLLLLLHQRDNLYMIVFFIFFVSMLAIGIINP